MKYEEEDHLHFCVDTIYIARLRLFKREYMLWIRHGDMLCNSCKSMCVSKYIQAFLCEACHFPIHDPPSPYIGQAIYRRTWDDQKFHPTKLGQILHFPFECK